MDYEKKYKEALEKAEGIIKYYKECNRDEASIEDLETIFPELKESDYEKIRKGIIKYLSWIKDRDGSYMPNNIPFDDMIAWLEKQGEKPLEWKEENVDELSEFELAMMHIGGSFFGEKAGLDPNSTDDVKEQAKFLLSLVPKQGWSEEDEQNLANSAKTCKDEQNSAWSEEDERMLQDVVNDLRFVKELISEPKYVVTVERVGKEIDWMKSLKDRYTWKPSDEQMDALQYVFRNINPPLSDKLGWDSIRTLELLYHDLKKLKENKL